MHNQRPQYYYKRKEIYYENYLYASGKIRILNQKILCFSMDISEDGGSGRQKNTQKSIDTI